MYCFRVALKNTHGKLSSNILFCFYMYIIILKEYNIEVKIKTFIAWYKIC